MEPYDTYGTKHRDDMKYSMSEPAKPFKPLNRRPSPFLMTVELERRNRLRRWWYAHSEEVGMFLWMVAITMMGAGAWFLWGWWPR